MKIGYDGKRALSNMTGLGNYSRLVIESIASEYPGDDLMVYAPEPRDNPRIASWSQHGNIIKRFPAASEHKLGKWYWRTYGITNALKTERIDIYHGLSNELPLNISKAGIPTVVTIHDVIYRTLPHSYKAPDRIIYDYKYGHSARNASAVIAISECTKRDVMRFYGVPEEKIKVIYQGCDPSFRVSHDTDTQSADLELLRAHNLPQRYIVQVGTVESRKNALLSVRALSAIRDKEIPLLLIGRPTAYADKILKEASELGIRERVILRSDLPFSALPTIVRNASLALYPSRYEGFGLPVLEAISCGTPVIAATGSCLEEAGGEKTIYVNPDDTRSMTEAIDRVLADRDLQAMMTAEGLRYAAQFSNDTVASNIHNLYEHLLRK